VSGLKGPQSRVLAYLREHGSINPIQAWTKCGAYRLGAVIFRLRKAYRINTTDTKGKNRFGEKCRFATYVFKGER
jgi:hypothetical protein